MRILHFADLHLGVENCGHIDPTTGLSTRLLDILASLDHLVDYALNNKIDLILFCGDAYKNREPSQTHQREFAKRISRLSDAGIPVLLLTGNHDLPNTMGRATSTEIFSTLSVKSVYVSSRPEVIKIPTKSGIVQVASLPWLRRGAMLSREDTHNLNFEQINERMQASLNNIIADHAGKLNPALPAVLAAHVWVAAPNLQVGSERMMTIGQEHALLLSNVASPAFDYIALGHIHKGQVLNSNPPVVYAGSLAKLDFGDEKDEKGFWIIDIEPDAQTEKRRVSYEFHPIKGRRFLTVDVTLDKQDISPMNTILQAIAQKAEAVKDAIVRLQLTVPSEIEGQFNDLEIKNALKSAHFFAITRDVKREARVRLGRWSAEEVTPLDALKLWLETKNTTPERTEILLDYGRKLIENPDNQ
ncbi:MAG: exonuclease SbcCD subunit D [Dehalococcoidales bacterium]|nr:exonuclease SbcCD subunit D [Dehalococcoidales bacterium]